MIRAGECDDDGRLTTPEEPAQHIPAGEVEAEPVFAGLDRRTAFRTSRPVPYGATQLCPRIPTATTLTAIARPTEAVAEMLDLDERPRLHACTPVNPSPLFAGGVSGSSS